MLFSKIAIPFLLKRGERTYLFESAASRQRESAMNEVSLPCVKKKSVAMFFGGVEISKRLHWFVSLYQNAVQFNHLSSNDQIELD